MQVYRIDGTLVGRQETMQPGSIRSFDISSPGTYIIKGVNKTNGEPVFVNRVVID